MKKEKILCLLLGIFCLPMLVMAQTQNLYEKYCDRQYVNSVYISKAMIEMNPNVFEKDPYIGKLSGKLESVTILDTKQYYQSIYRDFRAMVSKGDYEPLMKQKGNNSTTEFYIVRDGKNKVSCLLMLISKHHELKYVCLKGNFNLKDIQNIMLSQQTGWNSESRKLHFNMNFLTSLENSVNLCLNQNKPLQ